MNLDTIVKSGLASIEQNNAQFYLFNSKLCSDFKSEMLNANYWQQNDAVTGTAQGRGITYFVEHNEQQWVLRHYYRGGLVGKLINDSYLFSSYAKSRAVREYLLLATLSEKGLPAPTPIACKIQRKGLRYRADILTSRIANAKDVFTLTQSQSLEDSLWEKIGETIAQFHQHQVYHHDLNIHNILIDDQQKVWLIDFDQGSIKPDTVNANNKWQGKNLERLLRSFRKEKTKNPAMHWQEIDWQPLIEGYQQFTP